MSTSRFLPSHTERAIALARIVLGASGLFAIWMDPAEPARFVATTYALQAAYVLYAIVIAGLMWRRSRAVGPHRRLVGVGVRRRQARAGRIRADRAGQPGARGDPLHRAADAGGGDSTLADRLQALRERVALEWKVPVTIRITPVPFALSAALHQAVPLMAHEAIVNAVKHAHPTRIAVDVQIDDGVLRMIVSDDGSGFAFRGR